MPALLGPDSSAATITMQHRFHSELCRQASHEVLHVVQLAQHPLYRHQVRVVTVKAVAVDPFGLPACLLLV